MRHLYTADLHLTDREQDKYRWDIFPWLHKQVMKYKPKRLFFLGDLTDSKDFHSSYLTNRLVEEIDELAARCPVYVLKGNHDYLKQEQQPFFRFFNTLNSRVEYISKPTERLIDGLKFLFLPHTLEWQSSWKRFSFSSYDRVLFHCAIGGARTAAGFRLGGVPACVFNAVRASAFAIGGDIHVPQVVGRAVYCGAPHPVHFGDEYQPRILLTTEENVLRTIPRDTVRKLSLSVRSMKELGRAGIRTGDMVRVVVHCNPEECKDSTQIREDVARAVRKRGGVLVGVEVHEMRRQRLGKLHTAPTLSAPKLLKDYALQHRMSVDEMQEGMFLLKEVQL